VAFPEQFPPEFKQVAHYNDDAAIPIDPKNWTIITDAMAQVVSPVGTAGRAAIAGVDIAGKTGSSQTVSNEYKKKMSASEKNLYKDNGWFVGVTPRRTPEIVVACLFEGGEHGALAAQVATKVIKAYVEKQRNKQTQVAKAATTNKAEVAAVWHEGDAQSGENKLQGGRFTVPLDANKQLQTKSARATTVNRRADSSTLQVVESHTEMANPEVDASQAQPTEPPLRPSAAPTVAAKGIASKKPDTQLSPAAGGAALPRTQP
jgi:penicillin-binding protein 2